MTESDLLHALRDCYDPVLRRNIVELKRVQAATLTPDLDAPRSGIAGVPPRYVARISVLAPGSDEAANAQFTAQIENRLLGLETITRVEITLLPALFPIL